MPIEFSRPRVIAGNRPTIGVLAGWQVYTGTLNSFLDRVFQGIIAGAADQDCNLILACGFGPPYSAGFGRPAWPIASPEVDYLPVGPQNCDGLIVVNPIGYPCQVEFIDQLVKSRFPAVFTGEIPGAAVMTVENYDGIRQAVDHLVAHGHRRIAYVSGRHGYIDSDSQNRRQAYLDGIHQHGIAYDPDLEAVGHQNVAGGKQAIGQILSRKTDFSAVIASNDLSAIGVMQALQEAGLQVPRDVAVIGFDDRIDARAQVPMLTTIHFPMFELGYQAVDFLLKYIHGALTTPEWVRIPTKLVIRESCGCLAGMNTGFSATQPPTRSASNETVRRDLTQAIIHIVESEEYHLGRHQVDRFCKRLVESFQTSLTLGDFAPFATAFQQILAETSSQDHELFFWHKVITELRNWMAVLMSTCASQLTSQQALEMLNQTRLAVSEILQGQMARRQVRQAEISMEIGELSACLFNAHHSHEVYEELSRRLPGIGIEHAVIAYQEEGLADGSSWSEIQNMPFGPGPYPRFPAWQFPPKGLYPTGQPFHLALVPLFIQGVGQGFVALDTGNMAINATIVQQLTASLRGTHLYQEAIEARLIAEEEKCRVEEANRVKNRFLSWVIHELRTPVNLIYGLSDMLLQEKVQVDGAKVLVDREDIDRFHIGAEHLVNLIRDVLDLSASEMGQLKLVFEMIDLKDELEQIISFSRQLAQNKGLVLRTAISGPLPRVRGDRTRIRQIILNILNNAIKFTTQGEVLLGASCIGEMVLISIQDTGLGIPPGEQTLIFEEFRQSERTSERGFGGLGLGLAICKRLVEMHGGKIGVYSSGEEGQGSTFYFTLPIAVEQPGNPVLPQAYQGGHKILLMVNDAAEGGVLKGHLERQGYEVAEQVVTGEFDWLVKIVLEQPEAVVLDLGLASRLGWEILKTLKENPATQEIPVLFCSLEESSHSGSLLEFDYLTKPVRHTDLTRALLSQEMLKESGSPDDKKTILIVDDESEVLDLHARMVRSQFPTCHLLLAHNGQDALRLIHQHRPDLVLLDLMMPEVDGFTVLERMQKDEDCRNIPVVVLTGQALSLEDVKRLNSGVTSMLGKGMYSQEETLSHLKNALTHRRKAGSETQKIVLKAIAYIHANYSSQITRKDMAEYVGLSERHLTRCFNLELGLTPMTYLNRYRVKQARQLLESGPRRISEIAEKVGFSSGGYFSRVFRDEVGISPRDYEHEQGTENLSQK